jgi:hypothetical protein
LLSTTNNTYVGLKTIVEANRRQETGINREVREIVKKIETLERCDTGKDGRILDSNNEYSYSCLCFQEETFIRYSKKFNLFPYAEENEYLNFINDCEIQEKLAYKMISESKENLYHWKNTAIKLGLISK